MIILGFESSCDETGVAIVCTERGLLSHALHTQVAMHAAYGGVVPELASRDHVRRVVPLTRTVLGQAGLALAYRGCRLYGGTWIGRRSAGWCECGAVDCVVARLACDSYSSS